MRENDVGRVLLARLTMTALGSAYAHSPLVAVSKAAIPMKRATTSAVFWTRRIRCAKSSAGSRPRLSLPVLRRLTSSGYAANACQRRLSLLPPLSSCAMREATCVWTDKPTVKASGQDAFHLCIRGHICVSELLSRRHRAVRVSCTAVSAFALIPPPTLSTLQISMLDT
jgi:hypothetical protein